MRRVRVIGAGRAGRSFAGAIDDLDDWNVLDMRAGGSNSPTRPPGSTWS